MADDRTIEPLRRFLASIAETPWLANAGEPHPRALVIADVASGWDEWNDAMLATWLPRSRALEARAAVALGDATVTKVFEIVGATLHDPVRAAILNWFDRRPNINDRTATNTDLGLWPELLDSIKRDVAWAAVERIVEEPGLFSVLLELYADGRWPCSWDGTFPDGRPVVL